MKKTNKDALFRARLLTFLLFVGLSITGCGGGGGGEGAGSSSSSSDIAIPNIAQPPEPPSLSSDVKAALSSGNPSVLRAEDADALLGRAASQAWSIRNRQMLALASIYGTDELGLSLNHTKSSSAITVNKTTVAAPLILADAGDGMAAIAEMGNGRGLAYGADVLAWMAGTTREQQHFPFFLRAFRWLVQGDGNTPLPGMLRIASAGYDANTVKTFIVRAGSTATVMNCAVADPSNTCWQNLDVIVFGGGVPNSIGLSVLVRKYLEGGKSVVYMHPGWTESSGGRTVLSAMGMTLGGYPGNYFASADEVSVGSGRTLASALAGIDQLGPLVKVLQMLSRTDLKFELSNSPLTAAIDTVHTALAAAQGAGAKLFSDPDYELYRSLVLWADLQRRSINYGGKLSAAGDTDNFLRTYASDSWLWFNRTSTIIPPNGAGDYMPASAANIAVNNDFETIDVTIPQAGGITLIGRAAVPGKPVTIQIVDAAGATGLGLQTNFLRVWGKPLTDATYARPRRPNSFRVPLSTSGDTDFVSPFGGPLMLAYEGTTANTVIRLRIKGAAKYAHFDYTANPSDVEVSAAIAALNQGDFGWQTAKFVGGEVQQTTKLAKAAMGSLTPEQYILGRLKGQLFDSNHFANGYDNMPMSISAQNLCTQLGWVCTGPLHKAPNVQHFVGWLATCGFLCSGNPSDGSAGIGSGWGHAHELGHNTVQRVMHIAPNGKGCLVECDNNILASASMLRQNEMLGLDTGHSLDHTGLYGDILANRATGLTGDAQLADMESRLWAHGTDRQDPLRAVHFQLAFQYTKLRLAQPQPTMYSTLEFFQLLTKADRLVSKAWDPNNKNKYGMNRFADNKISNEDLLYVLSSKIIGLDMRKHFAMYGIPLSQTALDSITDLGLSQASRSFYALQVGKHNQLSTGQWLAIEAATPAYPWGP